MGKRCFRCTFLVNDVIHLVVTSWCPSITRFTILRDIVVLSVLKTKGITRIANVNESPMIQALALTVKHILSMDSRDHVARRVLTQTEHAMTSIVSRRRHIGNQAGTLGNLKVTVKDLGRRGGKRDIVETKVDYDIVNS